MRALLFLLTGLMNPLTVPQENVLPVFGCGSSCRVETGAVVPTRGDGLRVVKGESQATNLD